MASLNGKVIAYLEARMRSEMGSLIERHGGVPYAAPVLQEKYLTGSPEIRQLVEDVCQDRLDVVVLLTGVGTRALVEAADSMGLKDRFLASLNQRTIIARSPKPARVLRQHNIHIDLMPPEPYTSQDLISALGPNALNPSAQTHRSQRQGHCGPGLRRSQRILDAKPSGIGRGGPGSHFVYLGLAG